MFDNYLESIDSTEQPPTELKQKPIIKIAKYPPYPGRLITAIEQAHNTHTFSQHLREYLNTFLAKNSRTSNAVAQLYSLPFQCVDCYTQFKFHPNSLINDYDRQDIKENDTVKAIPRSSKNVEGRMDTVIVSTGDETEAVGVGGKLCFFIIGL